MFYQSSKKYLKVLQKGLVSSDYIFSLLTIIEILPVIYQSIKSSYYISYSNYPTFIDNLSYISFYHFFLGPN